MGTQFFPFVIVVVMLALGLTLTIDDFKRAATLRRPLVVALLCQSLVLPALCLLIAEAFHLQPTLAIGLMLMAATPGGTTSSVLSHLVKGDLALNVTLTAVNAVLSIFTLPAILAVATTWFRGKGHFIPLPPGKFLTVFGFVLIPVAIGIAIRHRYPEAALRFQRPVRILAAVLFVVVVVAAITAGRTTLFNNLGALSGAVVCFCAVSLTVGYLVPRWMRLAPRQSIAISLEIGMHNGALALAIALSPQLLNSMEMAMPAAVYGALAPLIALTFIFTVRRLDSSFRETSNADATVDEEVDEEVDEQVDEQPA